MDPARSIRMLLAAGVAGAALLLQAQPLTTKATTLGALLEYPLFYHGSRVALQAAIERPDGAEEHWLVSEAARVRVVGPEASETATPFVVRGTFWDVGRLEADDPRVGSYGFAELSRELFGTEWPRVGELLVVVADSRTPAPPSSPPTLRSVVLDPFGYEGQRLEVVGRFRGRNLYGDLPRSPGRSQWDFVLQSADAALWVTDKQPRGDGFNLDVGARVDTGRWLRATGTVRQADGLVWVEAEHLELGTPPEETTTTQVEAPAISLPPPEVIFSAPLQDEQGVPAATNVRIQFSRDMNPGSFKGQVRVSSGGPDATAAAPIEFTTEYSEGNRVLTIEFTEPLAPFVPIRVDLLEGITSFDGQALQPWTLTFTPGS